MRHPSTSRKPLPSNASAHANANSLTERTLMSQGNLNSATHLPYTPATSEADIDRRRPLQLVDTEPLVDVRNWAEGTRTESVSSFTATDDTPTLNDDVQPYVISCDDSCAILPEKPAVWQVRGTDIKLSMLAVNVLLKHSLLGTENLECIAEITEATGATEAQGPNYTLPNHCPPPRYTQPNPGNPPSELKSRPTESGPTDPVTGAASAAFEIVTDILMGLTAGPIEAIHQVQSAKSQSYPRGSCPLKFDDRRNPSSYDKVAMGTAKGVGRVLGAALKAPVLVTTNVSMGFHNAPKLFGDDTVRDVDRVEGAKDGVMQAGKGFGTGLYDGITGLVTQPLNGAKKEGVLGGFKGFGKGIVGAVCKPAAGAVGLPAYALLGLWREGEKLAGKKEDIHSGVEHGNEGEELSENIRNILEKWDTLVGKEMRS